MTISFNSQGNLHKTIDFTIEEVYHHFVTNSRRKKLLDNSIPFFRHFSHCGCTTAYVGGSFASIKPKPGDIDLCFDLNQVDLKKLECVFPDFFDFNKLGQIRRTLECQILYFDQKSTQMFDMLRFDRDGFPKGLIKLNLKEITTDDQKRKTI